MDLGRAMACYATFHSLKNSFLHRKIDQFLRCGQKMEVLYQCNDMFLIAKTVLMLHMQMNISQRVYRKQKQRFENFLTSNPPPTV